MKEYKERSIAEDINDQFVHKYLQEANRCVHRLDRNGTIENLKAAMMIAGYDLPNQFEMQLGFLMFPEGGEPISVQCRKLGKVNGNVPGWNGIATDLRKYMQENGAYHVQLYYRIRNLINNFNRVLEEKGEEENQYICEPVSFWEVKGYDGRSEAELETRVMHSGRDESKIKTKVREPKREKGLFARLGFVLGDLGLATK